MERAARGSRPSSRCALMFFLSVFPSPLFSLRINPHTHTHNASTSTSYFYLFLRTDQNICSLHKYPPLSSTKLSILISMFRVLPPCFSLFVYSLLPNPRVACIPSTFLYIPFHLLDILLSLSSATPTLFVGSSVFYYPSYLYVVSQSDTRTASHARFFFFVLFASFLSYLFL